MSNRRTYSEAITEAQAQKVADGALLSLRIGKWLNRFITINFDTARLGDNARPFLQQDYLKPARDWLAYRDAEPMSYIAAFENRGGHEGGHNFHVHILMHVPIGLWSDFRDAQNLWIENGLVEYQFVKHANVLRDRQVIHYRKFLLGVASERDYLTNLRKMVLYQIKGAQFDTPAFLGLSPVEIEGLTETFFPSYQGRVLGRRVSVSHSLLSNGVSPALHPDPKLSWLEQAKREAEAGRAAHEATLKLGNPPPSISATPKAVISVAHRRRR